MAVYEYSCTECGRFNVQLAIGTAPDRHACPSCTATARRAFSAPMLAFMADPVRALKLQEERSRQEPEVVHQVPARLDRRPAPPAHPAHARLPRP